MQPSCAGNLVISSCTHGLDSSLTMMQASISWRPASSSSSMASSLDGSFTKG